MIDLGVSAETVSAEEVPRRLTIIFFYVFKNKWFIERREILKFVDSVRNIDIPLVTILCVSLWDLANSFMIYLWGKCLVSLVLQ